MTSLANEKTTGAILQDDYVLVTTGGSVRRIKVEDFVASIHAGNQQLLLEVAWGVPKPGLGCGWKYHNAR